MSNNGNPFDFSDFGGRVPGPPPAPAQPWGIHPQDPRRPGQRTPQPQPVPFSDNGFDPFRDSVPVRQQAGAVFGGQPSLPGLSVAGPPLHLVAAALAVACVGVILGAVAVLLDQNVLLAATGWVLAGPSAIGVLAWFSSADTRRRMSSVYSAPVWLSRAYWAVLVVCAAGIGLSAWQLALWAGTL